MAKLKKNIAEYIKAQGTQVLISISPAEDHAEVPEDGWGDLAVTTKQVQYQGGQSEEFDVSTLASKAKEVDTGLPDSGNVNLTGNFVLTNKAQIAIRQARNDGLRRAFRIRFIDGTGLDFIGLVLNYTFDINVGGAVNGTFSIRVSGEAEEVIATSPEQGGGE